jgi:hypothetical protein
LAVLAAFEAQAWPSRIDDPLEAEPYVDLKRRLNQTIKDLNDRLAPGTIRFHGDGTGTGVCWREAAGPDGATPPDLPWKGPLVPW